jgi:hypothetical protein
MIGDMRSFTVRVVALACVLVGLGAGPAAADPAGPSDFRSEVTGIEPAVDGVEAEIRGGDAFIELTVERGVEATVFDYSNPEKPYLRFLADGTVERNRSSPATYVNDDRKGGGDIPAEANDPDAAPSWEEVASDGTYAWHDHRVHWMQDATSQLRRGERVPGDYDPWNVPIEVDGQRAAVQGTLTFEDQLSPIPWAALALGAGGVLAFVGRGRAMRSAAGALLALSGLAVVVGRADFSSTPDGAGNPLLWILPLVAAVLAAVAVARPQASTGVVFALGAVASLSGWALLRFSVLTKPVLPTELPAALDRAAVAAAIGVSIAAAYLAVTSGAFKLPDLEDD